MKLTPETFTIGGKPASLYPADGPGRPLIVLHHGSAAADAVLEKLRLLGCPDCSLLCVGGLDWSNELSPWPCPPLSPQEPPFTGGADNYLALLTTQLLPQAIERLGSTPAYIGIAGYSLAGLFAVYALYRCGVFDRAASMSGSFWYPDFTAYCTQHTMQRIPDRIYLSLGDREDRTGHTLLRTVRTETDALARHFERCGIRVITELNPGNHFKNPALRCAKGIAALLGEPKQKG